MLPNNAVEYFVSYYDYYQPEAYIAQTDTYIEKDSSINEDVERLRHSATRNLLSRRDVVVVASVSCIYGLGTPQSYLDRSVELAVGEERRARRRCCARWSTCSTPATTWRSTAARSGCAATRVEIIPAYEELAIRIEFFGDEIEALYYLHPLTGDVVRQVQTSASSRPPTTSRARSGWSARSARSRRSWPSGWPSSSARASCSRPSGCGCAPVRPRDDPPGRVLLGHRELLAPHRRPRPRHRARPRSSTTSRDDFLLVIDESHVTVPQIGGMYEGDMSRKRNLVEFGFRLPSAVDNRPLTWEEFADRIGQTVYLSATPGPYELTAPAASSSSRSSGPPAWSTRRSSSSRPRARSTTSSTRSGPAPTRTSGCWSPR